MKHANYRVEVSARRYLIIRDIGPWDEHPTVTNDVEHVVKELAPDLGDRRLVYFDSEMNATEIVVRDGQFHCFAHFDTGSY